MYANTNSFPSPPRSLVLCQELRVSGFLDKIYPVMIGDREEVAPEGSADDGAGAAPQRTFLYGDYMEGRCYPQRPSVAVVHAVEKKLRAYLEQTSLGSPFLQERPVASVLSDIMCHQGGFVRGRLVVRPGASASAGPGPGPGEDEEFEGDAFSAVVDSIVRMAREGTAYRRP